MATPPFPYFGGKQTLANRIVERLPRHGHYVEPFAGSLAVLLTKPRSPMETVNDLDGDLMNFWRVLREQPEDLARVCALTPHARAEHQQSYDRPLELTDLERARRVWVCLTQGRGGMLRRTGWRHYGDASVSTGMPDYLGGYVQRLLPAAARLAGVSLECQPALEVIAKYGRSEGVLLYVDPPYLGSTRIWGNQYRHEMRTETDHRELAEVLQDVNAQVVLSGYDSDLYGELYSDWDRIQLPASTGNARIGERGRTEVLWSNRAISTPTLFDEAAS